MPQPNIADWLGGAGQALETLFVIGAFFFARSELRGYLAQRQLGHDEARATAAVDVWDTVVRAVDIVESLNHLPIKPGANDLVRRQLEMWAERSIGAVEGINRSLGRATLLLGDTDVRADLESLSEQLNSFARRSHEIRFPKSGPPQYPTQEFALATPEEVTAAQAASNRILRKLNSVALRTAPTTPV